MTIDDIRQEIVRSGLAKDEDIVGCSSSEVEAIETTLSVRLPVAHRDFLLAMGKSTGRFLQGEDVRCADLESLQTAARFIADESGLVLPADALVFMGHQGYRFYFFLSGDQERDPLVYIFEDGDHAPEKLETTFIELLHIMVEQEASLDQGPSSFTFEVAD